ncbi:MAG: SDR family NAD(P)-dependent oxidoreductase [Actinomycetota bacterium]|nr:SDR family NAD(P)-dependent oxidoreductase [Actinomycetota bacterium]
MDIAGKTVLVTGATGGLGQALARALALQGAKLLLTGRRGGVLDPLAREVGGRAIACDLSDRSALEGLIDDAGEVDALVANAGIPASGLVPEYSVEQIDRALDVNLRAPILLARALVPAMVARGDGHLLFMSSLSGKVAVHRSAIYSATKFGLRGFALGLRQDLLTTGVGVSVIFPGPIAEAGMFADTSVDLPRLAGSRSPEDVGSAVVEAIERNRAEIDVAPLPMRLGTSLGSVAPGALAAVNRLLGAESIAEQVADSESQRSKR